MQSAALVGQCLVFATSCLQPFNSEDIVALMKHTLPICESGPPALATAMLTETVGHEKLLREMYESCDIAVDFTFDNKSDGGSSLNLRLLSNIPLVRCLSIQQTLQDDNGVRTVPAKVGSIMLELRTICVSVYTAMNTMEEIPEGSLIGQLRVTYHCVPLLIHTNRLPMVSSRCHEMVHRYDGIPHPRTSHSPARNQRSRD